MRFISIIFLIVSAGLASQVLSQTNTQQIDVNAVYRLTNDYAGPGKSLSVRGGAVTMADTGDATDQLWKLVSVGGGKYRLVNAAAGTGKSLDNTKSGDQYSVVIGGTGNYTGQFWTLTPMAGGKYRLTNDYASGTKSLDARKNGEQFSVVMGDTGNYSGQFWTLKSTAQSVAINNPVPVIQNPSNGVMIVPTVSGPSIPVTPPSGTTVQPPTGPTLTFNNVIIPWDPNKIPKGGTLICSADLRASSNCGLAKADWVGKHEINLKCEKGFYDPIWGGTCWDFPKDDGNGTWLRGTTEVTADDAVWRTPKETTTAAQKVKTTALAWECGAGTFWDGWSGSGSGGAGCYQCPADHPRRTANPVYSLQACASAANETGKAVFLSYNGCPKPDPSAMGLTGRRMPGKPFLDIGGGGCYACPNADDDGTILVTDRNGNPVKSDQGCTVKLKWKSPEFPEPGMSGLIGIKEILVENFVLDNPDIVTLYLTKVAEDKSGFKPGTAGFRNYVEQQWQDIANHPYQNANLSSLMFGFLENAAQTDAKARTPAQRKLVASMEEYVRLRRTFIAEQALAMYDGWKANTDKQAERRAQSETEVLFDYGTVPLDFHSAALAGFGLSSAGVSTASGLVLANKYAVETARLANKAYNDIRLVPRTASPEEISTSARLAFKTATEARTLNQAFAGLREFRELSAIVQLGTAGPAVLIEVAGLILQSIAIDQFIAIQEARPKLLDAVEMAKKPVDLKAFLAEPDGKDQLTYFWSKAMDVKVAQEDPEIVAKARAAQALARQSGFQAGSAQ